MYETDIVQMSKDLMAYLVEDLTGDEDPAAFQIVRNADGDLGMALVQIPEGSAGRDTMADMLTAACCVHRASETTFSSTAWSSVYSNVGDVSKVRPAQRPNRVEVITLVHVNQERVEVHTAAVLRVDGKVKLSPWIVDPDQPRSGGGRIPEALEWGIKLAGDMPEEMIEALEIARSSIPMGRVMELFVEHLGGVRERFRRAAQSN